MLHDSAINEVFPVVKTKTFKKMMASSAACTWKKGILTEYESAHEYPTQAIRNEFSKGSEI